MNNLVYVNGLSAEKVRVKTISASTLQMQDVGSMYEFRRAVAQLTLLVGSQIRRAAPHLPWKGLVGLSEDLDELGLLNLTTIDDGDVLHGICRTAWNNNWPGGLSRVQGYTNACRFLEGVAELVCLPVSQPTVRGKAAHGKALWQRVTEALPRAEMLGVNIPELDRLMTILRSCERGDTFIACVN